MRKKKYIFNKAHKTACHVCPVPGCALNVKIVSAITFTLYMILGNGRQFVIPIYKGGPKASPVNFRPVSLTSHIIKTMERVIRIFLVRHLEVHNKLNPNQHGFRSQRSCLSQLLEYHDEILSNLEEGNNVDSIYLDFSKAFDKVDIGI